jgi:hypothetical protein
MKPGLAGQAANANGRFPASFEDVIAHRARKGRQERPLAGIRWAPVKNEVSWVLYDRYPIEAGLFLPIAGRRSAPDVPLLLCSFLDAFGRRPFSRAYRPFMGPTL